MFIPEPKFYLKDRNSKDSTLIYMQAKYTTNKQERFMLSSGDKILPDEWDDIKQRAIVSKRSVLNGDINMWLDKMATAFKTVFRNYLLEGKLPDAIGLKNKVEESLNLKPLIVERKNNEFTFIEFINKFIDNSKATKALNTIKSYISTLNRIKEYEHLCNKEFSFADINLDWHSGFIKYLQSLGVRKNTVGKHMKIVKVFMNEATERKINENMAFRSRSFDKPSEDVQKIFLSKQEIDLLAKLDLTGSRMKEITRDYFLVACYTSLRYSDLIKICKENIKGNCLYLTATKVRRELIIPISPMVRAVFEKYNYQLPKAPCNQVFNRHIKEIGKAAGLNEKIILTKTIGVVKETQIKEKWQLLSSHVGRGSLINNCILDGINNNSIMLISGHKSIRVFNMYVKISQQQNADVLSNHPFFSN